MGSASSVSVRRDSGIITATLNRPGQMNAMNKDLFEELKTLIEVLETDKTARVLMITGSGEKAFCVGADLKERQGMNEKDVLRRLELVHRLLSRIENLTIPVIAAINGHALGGGLELALACDFRVAADNASLGLPEVDLAIIPGTGGTQRLPRLVGMGKALELILLAKRITAKEALAVGLVNSVVAEGQAIIQAMSWAHKLAEAGPIALKSAKQAIRRGMSLPLEAGLQAELESYKACLYSKDRMEGLKAFSEKRKPVFRGRIKWKRKKILPPSLKRN